MRKTDGSKGIPSVFWAFGGKCLFFSQHPANAQFWHSARELTICNRAALCYTP